MPILEQIFTIHPVGQGLFYSSIVKLSSNSNFKLVFDCGSDNGRNCKEEIEQFRINANLPNEHIDTLVISHFDADHVNHIQKLLEGGVKVDKLIMPFILFEERLFLALNTLVDDDGIDDDDTPEDIDLARTSAVSFILDPTGSLLPNLEGGEIILVESGSDDPPANNESIGRGSAPEGPLAFDFELLYKLELSDDEKNAVSITSDGLAVKKTTDDHHAYLSAGVRIMEFIFYRRDIGRDEKTFYANVQREFCKHFGINETLAKNALCEAIKEKALKIASAGEIKAIFRKAKKGLKLYADGRDVVDPNTTSLCMLHRNLPAVQPVDDPLHIHQGMSIMNISKPEGTQGNSRETNRYDWHWPRFSWRKLLLLQPFPNVLLTSDSFIRDINEVESFYKKYQYYWDEFWLFQIPHHGAQRNANKNLLARLRNTQHTFINYGINNRHDHPNERLIHDLTTCGLSANYYSINEFSGLKFICKLKYD